MAIKNEIKTPFYTWLLERRIINWQPILSKWEINAGGLAKILIERLSMS
jgi:hypothetical protein